jgi:putative transposase
MGRSRYKVIEGMDTYFGTATVVNWLPIFSNPALSQVILDSLQYLHDQGRLILHAYVLLENHLHIVASSADFSAEVRNMKSYTARRIIDYLDQNAADFLLRELKFARKSHKGDQRYQLWQEGVHPQAILAEEVLKQKIEYLHYNPVRRGYVDSPDQWRYSSARQYSGEDGLVTVEPLW